MEKVNLFLSFIGLVLVGCGLAWALRTFIRSVFRIGIILKEPNSPLANHRETGGVIFNTKTQKLENAEGSINLPF